MEEQKEILDLEGVNDSERQLRISKFSAPTLRKVNSNWNKFLVWLEGRKRVRSDTDHDAFFKEMNEWNKSDWDFTLQGFVTAVRKPSGDRYPPATIKGFVTCIQFRLQKFHNKSWSFLTDPEFFRTRQCLIDAMRISSQEGLPVAQKRTRTIGLAEEERLWRDGKFGMSDPEQLVSTLIYYLGLHLSLRSCQEQRNLLFGRDSQLRLVCDDEMRENLIYTERKVTNSPQSTTEPRTIKIYPHDNRDRCIVAMYKTYVSHRPESFGLKGHEAFYLSPLKTPPSALWYRCQPMGVHTIESVVKKLLASGSGEGRVYSFETKGPAAPTDMRPLQQPGQPQHPRISGPPERERVLCPNCGKTYCRKDVLEAHLRTSCRGVKAAAAAAQSADQPAAKVARLDLNHHLAFRCELCPSQFSSSLGLVVHRSKCHPQFYGPTHRRAMAAAAAAASAASTSASTVAPSAVGPLATAAAPSQTPSADQGPLLSLPHRCSQCPRAFLTVGRLKEHLSSVHADAALAAVGNGVAVNAEDTDGDNDDVMGGLVLDDAVKDKDESPAGDAQWLNVEEEAHVVGNVDFVDSMNSAEYPEADVYLCSECGGSYQTFDLLNRHLMELHEIDSVTPEPPSVKLSDTVQQSHEPLLYPSTASSVLPTGARKRKSVPMSMN